MTKVNLGEFEGFSPSDIERLMVAGRLLERVVNTEMFQKRVCGFAYTNNEITYSDFRFNWITRGKYLSRTEVYNRIMTGSEYSSPGVDNEFDISLKLYSSDQKVIGYTFRNSRYQWINKLYFGKMKDYEIAGNLMHEYTHRLGFDHEFKWCKARDFTVPYACGSIVRQIGKELS